MEPTTATTKVFDVAELLEHILSHLPMKDILLAQRVSKQFRHAIKNSLTLQRKLFYLPSKTENEDRLPKVNPFLEKLLNLQGLRTAGFKEKCCETGHRRLLPYTEGVGSATVGPFEQGKPARVALHMKEWGDGETREAPKGSWEDMRVADIESTVFVRHPNSDRWELKDPVLSEVSVRLPGWYF